MKKSIYLFVYITVPTYVKMQFQPYKNTEELTIFMDSSKTNIYKENKADSFKFLFTNNIRFQHCEIALNSITFKNNFKILSDLALDFEIEQYQGDLVTKKEKFETPKTLQNHDEIIKYFLSKVEDIVDWEKSENGSLILKFKTKARIIIEEHLAEILGSNLIINQICTIAKLKDDTYVFQHSPRKIPLYPNQLFITCSFVQHTVFGGILCPLLRIIPIKVENSNEYTSIDFSQDQLEYIPCRFSNLKELQFNIGSHTMGNVGFMNTNDILHMSIVLRKY